MLKDRELYAAVDTEFRRYQDINGVPGMDIERLKKMLMYAGGSANDIFDAITIGLERLFPEGEWL